MTLENPNPESDKRGTLSEEQYARLLEIEALMGDAPEPSEHEAAVARSFTEGSGRDEDVDRGEKEVTPGESKSVDKVKLYGKTIHFNEDGTVDIELWRGGKPQGLGRLTHGTEVYVDPRGSYGQRHPADAGKWYWDDNEQTLVRRVPTSAAPARQAASGAPTEAAASSSEDEIDARTRRVEEEIAAARARAAAEAGRDAGTQTEFDREFRGVRYRVEGTGDGARALVHLAPKNGRERAPRVVQNNSTHRMPDGAGRIVPHRFVGATGAWEPVRDDGTTRTRTDDPGGRTTERTIVDPAVAVRLDGVERILTEMQAGLRDLHGTRPAAAGGEPPVPPRTEPAVDPILPPPTAPTLSMLERWGEGDIPDPNSPKESLRLRMVQHIVRERARQHRGSLFNLFGRRPHPKTDAGEMRLAQEYYQDAQRAREEWPHASKVGFGATMLGGGLLGTFVLGSAWLALAPWVAIMPAVVAGMATGSLTYRQLKKEKNPHAGLIGALAGAGTALTAWFGGNWLFGDGTI